MRIIISKVYFAPVPSEYNLMKCTKTVEISSRHHPLRMENLICSLGASHVAGSIRLKFNIGKEKQKVAPPDLKHTSP